MSENIDKSGASSEPTWELITPEVKIRTVEDMKNVLFKNTKTGEVLSAYDKLMMDMGIAAASSIQKNEEHRKKAMKELKDS